MTLCCGSYMAVHQTDLNAILAFCTNSQLGMIVAMLGFGTKIAIFAAVFHILNHATFKGSLFMVAGIIDHQMGTRDIRKLGGLMTFMPMVGTLALFGTFSMAGIPLPFLNGFYSKELFFESSLLLNDASLSIHAFLIEVIPYLAVLGSIFTFVYSMYFFFGVFMGKKNTDELTNKPAKAPFGIIISPLILIIGVILIGLFPNMINGSFIAHAAEAVSSQTDFASMQFWHGLNTPFMMSLLVGGAVTILALTRIKWNSIYNILPGRVSLNKVYDFSLRALHTYSTELTNTYMVGSLRVYMSIIIGTIFIVTLLFMFLTGGLNIQTNNLADISVIEIIVALVMVTAAIGTILSNHKVA